MVTDFVCRVFNGSATPLVEHLIESEQISREEVEQIFRESSERRTRSEANTPSLPETQ
jgi:hypothetical protein